MNNIFRCVLVIAFGIVGGLSTAPSRAQVAGAIPTPPGDKLRSHIVIKLHHLRPSLVASWLDQGYENPPAIVGCPPYGFYVVPKLNTTQATLGHTNETVALDARGEKSFLVPEGIQQVVAVDTQSVILIYGLNTALEKAKALIEQLDKPLAQIEVRFQEISTDDQGAKSLGVTSDLNGKFMSGAQDSEKFQDNLKNLVEAGNTEIIQEKSISALSSIPAQISSIQLTPATMKIEAEGKALWTSPLPSWGLVPYDSIYIANSKSFIVIPMIDKNGETNLALELSEPLALTDARGTELKLLEKRIVLQSTIHLADNRIVCVGGLRTATMNQEKLNELETDKLNAGQQLYFVSAQIFKPGGKTKPEIIFAGP